MKPLLRHSIDGICTEVAVLEPSTSVSSSIESKSRYAAFSKTQRRWIVVLVALAAFIPPLSVFIYMPIIDTLAEELDVSIEHINITITSYLLVQGLIPALLSNLSDQLGRRVVYLVSLPIFCAACVGLALQESYPELLIFRMVQSAGTSGLLALGALVVTDVTPRDRRGRYMSGMLIGVNLGPVVAPVAGGFMADTVGWHQCFWLLLAFGSSVGVLMFGLLPETCRHVVGGHSRTDKVSWPVSSALAPVDEFFIQRKARERGRSRRRCRNPFMALRIVFQAEDALILVGSAFVYLSFTCMQDSLAHLAIEKYELSGLQAGLCYVPYGLAVVFSSYGVGKMMDHDYLTVARASGLSLSDFVEQCFDDFPVERARLRTVWYLFPVVVASTVGYGWAIEAKLNLAVIMVMQFLCCLSSTGICNTCLTLYMDIHPRDPGAASVAMNLVRSLAGAGGVAVVQLLVDEYGTGWTFSGYGVLCFLSVPMLLVVRTWGPGWRKTRYQRAEVDEK